MIYLVLLKGGVRKWQTLGHLSEPKVVWNIPVPRHGVFSWISTPMCAAAEFTSREAAQTAINVTEKYIDDQITAGNPNFTKIPGIKYCIAKVEE